MPPRFIVSDIDAKWQRRWADDRLYEVDLDRPGDKWYFLTMYPYPSGDLHVGHWYPISISDAMVRYLRMTGKNVFFPMGFDAFGLPAENAAIKRGVQPRTWTMENIERMRGQLRAMGTSIDWSKEIVTCEPEYYRWNQWLFLKFFEKGLAYRDRAAAWWCPNDKTVLANEQVLPDGSCERCGAVVSKRDLDQWFLRITAYADELLDHSEVEWPERVITMQRNWIGKSTGGEIAFDVEGLPDEELRVFTTRPDTVFGVSFMVLAPEHPLVGKITTSEQRASVDAYVEQTRRESEIERLSIEKDQTGVATGAHAVNRLSGERVPIYVADYVLITYGTGCVMGVPAHDTRDFAFARKYGLPISIVIAPPDWSGDPLDDAYLGEGTMVNSGEFDGLPSEEGKQAIISKLDTEQWGKAAVTYRLRDWLISRQRYWGTPIPIIYCRSCGTVPVPEQDLPVLLPDDAEFKPSGESPLKRHEGFRNVACPRCGGPSERETDTMDTFVDSSWYQYRFLNPDKDDWPVDLERARNWLPVDQYTGGVEHATMHLLYTRFFTKAMRDAGVFDSGARDLAFNEPMTRLFNQGIILGEDNEKMSKSRGNVVNPDDYVSRMGADAVRQFLMFIGPWDEGGAWNSRGIEGIIRFQSRAWALVLDEARKRPTGNGDDTKTTSHPEEAPGYSELRRLTHKTIRKVTEDYERMHFNTMLAALMEFLNALYKARDTAVRGTDAWNEAIDSLVLIMAPSAPHLAEELWERMGRSYSVHQQRWPKWDRELAADEATTIVLQVNGKMRDKIDVPVDADEATVKELALANERVVRFLKGREVKKTIYVPGRLVNIVA